MDINGMVGPQTLSDGVHALPRLLRDGSVGVSEICGRYYEQAKRGQIFMARAIVTAPVIFSTAAGTGGPLLWNGTTDHDAVLLAVGFGTSVVTTVAGALGLTGASGQSSAPGSTTTIDSVACTKIGSGGPAMSTYRVGTPTNAGTFFMPFSQLHTGALTVDTTGMQWLDLGGMFVVPPGSWASPAGSATLSTLVAQIGLIWAEVPV